MRPPTAGREPGQSAIAELSPAISWTASPQYALFSFCSPAGQTQDLPVLGKHANTELKPRHEMVLGGGAFGRPPGPEKGAFVNGTSE